MATTVQDVFKKTVAVKNVELKGTNKEACLKCGATVCLEEDGVTRSIGGSMFGFEQITDRNLPKVCRVNPNDCLARALLRT